MKPLHKTFLILAMLLAGLIGLVLYQTLGKRPPNQAELLEAGIVLLPQPRPVPVVRLIDQNGQPVAVEQLVGGWTLVFFGYTFCPDICPTTLGELKQLQGKLPPDSRARLRTLMISVDPQRDTPEQLKSYLAFFDPSFRGLTGRLEDIQTLSGSLGIPFIPGDTTREHYTVDHSGNLALIGPDGRQRGFIRAPLNIGRLAEQLPALVRDSP